MAEVKKVTGVAIYVRVSTDRQEADNQLFQLRDYCQKAGYPIHKEYVDVISGKEENRPDYDDMFRDANQRKFDLLLFWDLSRFSRAGVYHTIMKLKELDNLDIAFHSLKEPYLSTLTMFRDAVIAILAEIAKCERERISERTKAGLERAVREGKKLGRRPMQINFQRVWAEYEAQGQSINKTAKVLPYGYGTVYKIIKNRVYNQEQWLDLIKKGREGRKGGKSE